MLDGYPKWSNKDLAWVVADRGQVRFIDLPPSADPVRVVAIYYESRMQDA